MRQFVFLSFRNKLIAAINCFDVYLLMAAFRLRRFPPENINCKVLLHINIRSSLTGNVFCMESDAIAFIHLFIHLTELSKLLARLIAFRQI